MGNCIKCNLDHQRLGIRIEARTLHRRADKQKHMLRTNGGGWAFESALLSNHKDVDYIIITDRNSGETWRVDRQTFDAQSYDFGAGGRPQRALGLRFWDDGHEQEPQPQPDESGVQLIMDMGSANQRTIYERAKKPRPRLEPKRRVWW